MVIACDMIISLVIQALALLDSVQLSKTILYALQMQVLCRKAPYILLFSQIFERIPHYNTIQKLKFS